MREKSFPAGMTIRELKDWLAELPDTDGNGEPHQVWIQTGPGLSSVVTHVNILNFTVSGRPDLSGDVISADALLGSNAFAEWRHGE